VTKKRIFLDAGHNDSGWNTGAVGNGLREQDISYEVCKLVSGMLLRDFEVRLSRETREVNLGTDNASSINKRWQMANNWCADYFISVHCNAFNGTAHGAETLYFKDDSKKFATVLQDIYVSEMGISDRGIKFRNDIAVIRHTRMPSVLIELGFIDNIEDAFMLRTKKAEMAAAIVRGVYKVTYGDKEVKKDGENENKEELEMQRFNTIEEIPTWGRPTIEKLQSLGFLNGNENGLDISEDMLRIFVVHDRIGIYD